MSGQLVLGFTVRFDHFLFNITDGFGMAAEKDFLVSIFATEPSEWNP